jgi:hypothetical protein
LSRGPFQENQRMRSINSFNCNRQYVTQLLSDTLQLYCNHGAKAGVSVVIVIISIVCSVALTIGATPSVVLEIIEHIINSLRYVNYRLL